MKELTSQFFSIDQVKIHCYTAGNAGTPVIFLHGGGIDSASLSWEEIIPPFSEGFQVFAPDLPGFGKSEKPDVTYSPDFYVDFLQKFIDQQGLQTVHLVGLSLGGGIAIRYSLLHPDPIAWC